MARKVCTRLRWMTLLTLAGLFSVACLPGCTPSSESPAPESKPETLAGSWVSVDFVRTIDEFTPGQKSWQGDLFLKDFTAEDGGTTSQGWTWSDGWVTHSNGRTRYQYTIKDIGGTAYLFLPWLSGDVTERGMAPLYYVLTRAGAAPASTAPSTPAPPPPAATPSKRSIAGSWISVSFVEKIDDFKPGQISPPDQLFLKDFTADVSGGTSLGWTWTEGWITHSNGRTRAQYTIKDIAGASYLFLPWLSGDVTERGMAPRYYVMIPSGPAPAALRGTGTASAPPVQSAMSSGSFQTIRPVSAVGEFDDVRWKDLKALNLAERTGLIATLNFNQKTVWPPDPAMPPGKTPKAFLHDAMDPGLGIRGLHRQGITGEGVNVAIIDQPLYDDHPEFKGKIAAYHDVGCKSESSMHGPAVASLLVGRNCGTAPGARLYFVAAPSWTKDTAYQAKALDWIIEQNASLPDGQKIRVVSVSACPSGEGSPFTMNTEQWDEAYARAEAAGMLVLDCTQQ
ncbi:MAG: hypothetical protein K1Y02_25295, partial [Candidatus Hydrogenedentes bacterium]|nr:hypothetical protein [Candidatus Hydrogenedentota bacterium]